MWVGIGQRPRGLIPSLTRFSASGSAESSKPGWEPDQAQEKAPRVRGFFPAGYGNRLLRYDDGRRLARLLLDLSTQLDEVAVLLKEFIDVIRIGDAVHSPDPDLGNP